MGNAISDCAYACGVDEGSPRNSSASKDTLTSAPPKRSGKASPSSSSSEEEDASNPQSPPRRRAARARRVAAELASRAPLSAPHPLGRSGFTPTPSLSGGGGSPQHRKRESPKVGLNSPIRHGRLLERKHDATAHDGLHPHDVHSIAHQHHLDYLAQMRHNEEAQADIQREIDASWSQLSTIHPADVALEVEVHGRIRVLHEALQKLKQIYATLNSSGHANAEVVAHANVLKEALFAEAGQSIKARQTALDAAMLETSEWEKVDAALKEIYAEDSSATSTAREATLGLVARDIELDEEARIARMTTQQIEKQVDAATKLLSAAHPSDRQVRQTLLDQLEELDESAAHTVAKQARIVSEQQERKKMVAALAAFFAPLLSIADALKAEVSAVHAGGAAGAQAVAAAGQRVLLLEAQCEMTTKAAQGELRTLYASFEKDREAFVMLMLPKLDAYMVAQEHFQGITRRSQAEMRRNPAALAQELVDTLDAIVGSFSAVRESPAGVLRMVWVGPPHARMQEEHRTVNRVEMIDERFVVGGEAVCNSGRGGRAWLHLVNGGWIAQAGGLEDRPGAWHAGENDTYFQTRKACALLDLMPHHFGEMVEALSRTAHRKKLTLSRNKFINAAMSVLWPPVVAVETAEGGQGHALKGGAKARKDAHRALFNNIYDAFLRMGEKAVPHDEFIGGLATLTNIHDVQSTCEAIFHAFDVPHGEPISAMDVEDVLFSSMMVNQALRKGDESGAPVLSREAFAMKAEEEMEELFRTTPMRRKGELTFGEMLVWLDRRLAVIYRDPEPSEERPIAFRWNAHASEPLGVSAFTAGFVQAMHAMALRKPDESARARFARMAKMTRRTPLKKAVGGSEKTEEKFARRRIAAGLHNTWRFNRLLPDGSYEPRMKEVDGQIYDIANLPFESLPHQFQEANLSAAHTASRYIEQVLAAGAPPLTSKEFLETASWNQHIAWMEANPWCTDPLQMCPYNELSEAEKEKDRVVVRLARREYVSYLRMLYTQGKAQSKGMSFELFSTDIAMLVMKLRKDGKLARDADLLEINQEFIMDNKDDMSSAMHRNLFESIREARAALLPKGDSLKTKSKEIFSGMFRKAKKGLRVFKAPTQVYQYQGSTNVAVKYAGRRIASRLHERWRMPRMLEDGTFTPRLKNVDGVMFDIANLDFDSLPSRFQKANLVASHCASRFIEATYSKRQRTDSSRFLEKASEHQHIAWMKSNPWCTDPGQMCSYAELTEEEKEKDRVVVRIALEEVDEYLHQIFATGGAKEQGFSFDAFRFEMASMACALRKNGALAEDADILEIDGDYLVQQLLHGGVDTLPSSSLAKTLLQALAVRSTALRTTTKGIHKKTMRGIGRMFGRSPEKEGEPKKPSTVSEETVAAEAFQVAPVRREIAAALHQLWCETRTKLSDGSYEARIKMVDGNVIDIANLGFEDLPPLFQRSNLDAAHAASRFVEEALAEGEEIGSASFLEKAAENQHNDWRKLNQDEIGTLPALLVDYSELAEQTKDTNRGIAELAMREYARYLSHLYEQCDAESKDVDFEAFSQDVASIACNLRKSRELGQNSDLLDMKPEQVLAALKDGKAPAAAPLLAFLTARNTLMSKLTKGKMGEGKHRKKVIGTIRRLFTFGKSEKKKSKRRGIRRRKSLADVKPARIEIAAALHQKWRDARLLADGTYEPRPKEVNGVIYDIANLSFEDLPELFQAANVSAAQTASRFVENVLAMGMSIDTPEFVEEASAHQHEAWLKQNPWCTDPLQVCPYGELLESEKEKDRAVVRIARSEFMAYIQSIFEAGKAEEHGLDFVTLCREIAQTARVLRTSGRLRNDADVLEIDPTILIEKLTTGDANAKKTAVVLLATMAKRSNFMSRRTEASPNRGRGSIFRSNSEQSQSLKQVRYARRRISSALHEAWKQSRVQDDGTFEPRLKFVNDVEYDIANMAFNELPKQFQNSNLIAAQTASRFVEDAYAAGRDITSRGFMEDAAKHQHDVWVDAHVALASAELLVPYRSLPEEEKEKNREVVRIALREYNAYMRSVYEAGGATAGGMEFQEFACKLCTLGSSLRASGELDEGADILQIDAETLLEKYESGVPGTAIASILLQVKRGVAKALHGGGGGKTPRPLTPGSLKRAKKKMQRGGATPASSETLAFARERIASKLHESWRETRLRDDGTFEPRIKELDGLGEVDIANLPFDSLPPEFQSSNLSAARAAGQFIEAMLSEKSNVNSNVFLEAAAQSQHVHWMKENRAWADPAVLVPYGDLPDVEKEKTRIVVRTARKEYMTYMRNVYRQGGAKEYGVDFETFSADLASLAMEMRISGDLAENADILEVDPYLLSLRKGDGRTASAYDTLTTLLFLSCRLRNPCSPFLSPAVLLAHTRFTDFDSRQDRIDSEAA